MRVWTIQPASVWEQIKEQGVAEVDPNRFRRAPHAPDEVYVPERYLWLVEQLKRRLPGYGGRLPWWAYCRKPDLRTYRFTRPVGPQVRLELEVECVVSFPIWAWNEVYCGGYLGHTARERADWYCLLRREVDEDARPYPEPWQSQLEATWERLFEPLPRRLPWRGLFSRSVGREAVVELLLREQVKHVTHFQGASRWL